MREDQEPVLTHSLEHTRGCVVGREHSAAADERAGVVRRVSALPNAPRNMGVSTAPGQMHETLMPRSAYVMAVSSAKPTAACFVAAYTESPNEVRMPAIDAVVIRWPSPRASQPGMSARVA